ncbi:MAG: tRNA lysidine(34) synthetase TilS [Candidatus Lightella neohaematopini]|nr:tRNA lysidine(34) synthetase TilS [Candidatus Lightella neohaematopini]
MINKDYTKYLQQQVIKSIYPYNYLLLAFSGGLDSMVLLDIITVLRSKYNNIFLRACYIDHQQNSLSSNQWLHHCIYECKQRDVLFVYDIIKVNKGNFEQGAREQRYQKLLKIIKYNEVLVTAHHQNDQVETFFLALKRGSGPRGLSAMSIDQPFYHSRLLRPLLNCSKTMLLSYANKNKLNWVNDDSNYDNSLDRNFLRNNIIPLLQKRWNNFCQNVTLSAYLCANQEQLINMLLNKIICSMIFHDESLIVDNMIGMNIVYCLAILRFWLIKKVFISCSYKKLNIIWNEVVLSKNDSLAKFCINNFIIQKFRNRLYVHKFNNRYKDFCSKTIIFTSTNNYKRILLPLNLGEILLLTINNINNKKLISIVKAPTTTDIVSIRFNIKGKTLIKLVHTKHHVTLKKIWKILSVPPWQRKIIPILFYNNKLIAAIGYFVTVYGTPINSNRWYLYWFNKNKYLY